MAHDLAGTWSRAGLLVGVSLGALMGATPAPAQTTPQNPETVTDASRISTTYSKNGGVKLGIRVHLDAGTEVEKIDVPTHAVDIARPGPKVADAALQTSATTASSLQVLSTFHGISDGEHGFNVLMQGGLPPDTDGAVGTTQYVQMVNLAMAVFSPPLPRIG